MRYVSDNGCSISSLTLSKSCCAVGDVLKVSFKLTLAASAPCAIVSSPVTVGLFIGTHGGGVNQLGQTASISLAKGSSINLSVSAVIDEWTESTTQASLGVEIFAEGATCWFMPYAEGAGTWLYHRIAPVISAHAFSDAGGHKTRYGGFVQGQSNVKFNATVAKDSRDSACKIDRAALIIGTRTYSSSASPTALTPGVISESGSLSYTYTVYDNMGLSASVSGTVNVLPYSAPELTTLNFERYETVYDEQGVPQYVMDDGGVHIWTDIAGRVSALGGVNAWQAAASWTGGTAVLTSGTDGSEFEYSENVSMITAEFSAAESWLITVVLSDELTSATYQFRVPKAGSIFNIEKTGVAVGMRSSGTTDNPLFQVGYVSEFREAVYNAAGRRMDYSESWGTFSLSGASAYSESDTPQIRRIGDVVYWRGAVKLNSALASAGNVELRASMVARYCPSQRIIAMGMTMQGAPVELLIDTTGRVRLFNRSAAEIPATALISLAMCYPADSDV